MNWPYLMEMKGSVVDATMSLSVHCVISIAKMPWMEVPDLQMASRWACLP